MPKKMTTSRLVYMPMEMSEEEVHLLFRFLVHLCFDFETFFFVSFSQDTILCVLFIGHKGRKG